MSTKFGARQSRTGMAADKKIAYAVWFLVFVLVFNVPGNISRVWQGFRNALSIRNDDNNNNNSINPVDTISSTAVEVQEKSAIHDAVLNAVNRELIEFFDAAAGVPYGDNHLELRLTREILELIGKQPLPGFGGELTPKSSRKIGLQSNHGTQLAESGIKRSRSIADKAAGQEDATDGDHSQLAPTDKHQQLSDDNAAISGRTSGPRETAHQDDARKEALRGLLKHHMGERVFNAMLREQEVEKKPVAKS